jgi:acyl-CoA synthetase (AMP-forming)/AMP-acid ligase II
MFAAAKLGAVIVPLNPRYTVPELQYMLRHSEATVVVCAENFNGVDYLQLFEGFLTSLPDLQYLVTVGEEDLWYDDRIYQFEDLESSGAGRELPQVDVDPVEDTFAILYTSGTMGKPKGVALTHENLLSRRRPRPTPSARTPTTSSSAWPPCSTCSAWARACSARCWPARASCCRSSSTRPRRSTSSSASRHGALWRAYGVYHRDAGERERAARPVVAARRHRGGRAHRR